MMFLPPASNPENDKPPSNDKARALAKQMLRDGLSPQAVEQKLNEQRVNGKTACRVVGELRSLASSTNQKPKSRYERGQRNMLFGSMWFACGLLVTLVTYAAAEGGGRYFLAWGAILAGFIQFGRGTFQVWNERPLVRILMLLVIGLAILSVAVAFLVDGFA